MKSAAPVTARTAAARRGEVVMVVLSGEPDAGTREGLILVLTPPPTEDVRLRREELALLDHVQYAPVIFQDYIEADVDLRITVVGDLIFPAAIYSQETSYKIDFRMDMNAARIEPATLPADVEAKLKEIEERLNKLRSPFRSAEKFWVEEIIDPRKTRSLLCEFARLAEPLRKPGPPTNMTTRP